VKSLIERLEEAWTDPAHAEHKKTLVEQWPELAFALSDLCNPAMRATYGSTVHGRDVPTPLAPDTAPTGRSAGRSGPIMVTGTSGTFTGARFEQERLLPTCPRCGSEQPFMHLQYMLDGEMVRCEDPWHLHKGID
jgi:hypothetical protein